MRNRSPVLSSKASSTASGGAGGGAAASTSSDDLELNSSVRSQSSISAAPNSRSYLQPWKKKTSFLKSSQRSKQQQLYAANHFQKYGLFIVGGALVLYFVFMTPVFFYDSIFHHHWTMLRTRNRYYQLQGYFSDKTNQPDAIVVGSGLAGLSATLQILDRGGKVVLIEKNSYMGGNSNKASSGINACCHTHNEELPVNDTLALFIADTTKSAGQLARPPLIETLTGHSAEAVWWLRNRAGVDLSLLAQLGGHSVKRTHRPMNGMVGAEIIFKLSKTIKAYERSGQVTILLQTKVSKLLTDDDNDEDMVSVTGVECASAVGNAGTLTIHAPNVILATGGFASDRSNDSYLKKYRPDLMNMPTTAGSFSTGDGITLATTELKEKDDSAVSSSNSGLLPAATIDMDQVQIHPTGWVDPADPDNPSKTLAAELMRGVGGILINSEGKRFCNELGTRDYVSGKMLAQAHNPIYDATGRWDPDAKIPTFSMILSSAAAEDAGKHVDLYKNKGLLKPFKGVTALARWLKLARPDVVHMLRKYQEDASRGEPDEFGKEFFRGLPGPDLEREIFYVGTVTPVVHYCMGGLQINTNGNVINTNGEIMKGLYAAGEVTGGVHGQNRLGGNSLLECTVYGSLIGKNVEIRSNDDPDFLPLVLSSELKRHNTAEDCWVAINGIVYDMTEIAKTHSGGTNQILMFAGKDASRVFAERHRVDAILPRKKLLDARRGRLEIDADDDTKGLPTISYDELARHNTPRDCWVSLHGIVYDLTAFANVHPPGSGPIHRLAGKDGTSTFSAVHNEHMLSAFLDKRVGLLDSDGQPQHEDDAPRIIATAELQLHNKPEDCWVALNGDVYDLTNFAPHHKAGAFNVHKCAGKDCSHTFNVIHKSRTLDAFESEKVGILESL